MQFEVSCTVPTEGTPTIGRIRILIYRMCPQQVLALPKTYQDGSPEVRFRRDGEHIAKLVQTVSHLVPAGES